MWRVVREYAKLAGIDKLAPDDLRRTCARLCHSAGGELEQIQFLLGHRSVETTERYFGSRQRLVGPSTITLESNRRRRPHDLFDSRPRLDA